MRKRINILNINDKIITHHDIDAEFNKEENDILTGTFTMPSAKDNGGSVTRNPGLCIIETTEDAPLRYYSIVSGSGIIFRSSWANIIDGGLLDTRRYIFAAVDMVIAEEKEIGPIDISNKLNKYLFEIGSLDSP